MASEASVAEKARQSDRVRVLVVDDSRVIRKAVGKILGGEFDLVEAEDGEAGWQQLVQDEHIELVVADVEMPRLDGYSLICRIRAAEPERVRGVPVIVITGAHDDITRDRAFACGATDFITKPIDAQQLLARTRAHAKVDQVLPEFGESSLGTEEPTAVDPLTQLHSRRYFLQRGIQDLSYAKRHGTPLSLIRVDLDNFRAVYRAHGDHGCDEILVWLAKFITSTTRTEDTAARISGGEFAMLVPAADRAEAAALCERLRAAVTREPFRHDDQAIPLTVSLGLATFGQDAPDTIEGLLALANQRLTLAKASGGNCLGVDYRDEVAAPEQTVMEEPDLETALKMLADGRAGELTPYLPDLIERLLPLLEHGNRELDLGMGFAVRSLRDKLTDLK